MKKVTTTYLKSQKGKAKISSLTSYDATFARLVDNAGVDVILVGDSLGMVIQGHQTTIPVTIEDVIYHTSCVSRVVKRAHIVADMPFMSYQASTTHSLLNAGRLLKEGGAESVKLEGGSEMVDTVKAMTDAGIPVMAHIGLRPQTVHQMGGYKIQGKTTSSGEQLVKLARDMENAGAYSLLLEGIAIETAAEITAAVKIPTIGISSGAACDGQILVVYDMLGMDPTWDPKFAKKYANLNETITAAIQKYIKEIQSGKFPQASHATHRG